MGKKIYRSRKNAVVGGVCGGIGEYFDIDPVLVRVIWLFAIFSGIGLLAYLVCWFLMPQKPHVGADKVYSQYEGGYYDEYHDYKHKERKEKTKLILGAGLIIVGGFSLMQHLMPWFDFDLIWPVILILGGFYLIYREKDGRNEK